MTEPILRAFRPDDLAHFLDRDHGLIPRQMVIEQALNGPSFTACINGKPFCCGGIMIPWKGMGMVWLTTGPEISQYGIWMTRTVRRILRDSMKSLGLVRLETAVYQENERNCRWIRALGFHVEPDGVATKYFPGSRNAVRYELTGD